jgi:multidrug transporter EmrE-like cation transporter
VRSGNPRGVPVVFWIVFAVVTLAVLYGLLKDIAVAVVYSMFGGR